MKKIVRIASFLLVVCLIAGMFTGCGNVASNREKYEVLSTDCINSGVVADNSNYTLEWDNDYKCVVLTNKKTETKWSTTPYDLYLAGEKNATISSPIEINVIHATTKATDFDRAYASCIRSGNMSAERLDNGVKVTYYFDSYQISVPVCYVLRDDSFAMTIDTEKITEGDEYRLLNISVAPFMCASKNNVEGNYLFVPSGTGALINATDTNGKKTTYSFDVYGSDENRKLVEKPIEKESVKMPVFGAKNGDKAMMGIIEQGAESTAISVTTGDDKNGYSNAYATVWVRGYDIYTQQSGGMGYSKVTITRNSEEMINTNITIGYYDLEGEKADYNGMAERYQKYLVDNKGLTKSSVEEAVYALSLQGNITTKKLFVGIPYRTVESLTTFKQATEIIKDIASKTGKYPTVQMVGYGASGVDAGEIAGGYKFTSAAGSLKEYAEIEKLAKDNGFLLSVDFELVKFNKSGNGISSTTDTAKSASKAKVKQQYNDFALRWYDGAYQSYYLLKRSELPGVVDKLIKKAQKLGITGISASSLGQIVYSDYFDVKYAAEANTEIDIAEQLTKIKEAGYKVVTDNANAYAATVSDSVLNVDIEPYFMDGIDEYVPFYQMVYKGYIPLYSEAINLAVDSKTAVLKAVASGTSFGFTVLGQYDTAYISSPYTNLFNGLYDDIKDEITATVDTYGKYYDAIKDAKIVNYQVLDNGLTSTTFDNGVVVYTNQTNEAKESPAGQVAAYGFIYTK